MDKKFILTPTEVKVIEPPTLFEINQSFDYITSKDKRYNGLKGEALARMVLFTNFILACKPVLIKGSRSSGKSNLIGIVCEYSRNAAVLSTSSDKAEYRDFQNLNKSSHFIIPEINQLNDVVLEMLKAKRIFRESRNKRRVEK